MYFENEAEWKISSPLELAKKNYYPDVTIGVDYIDTGGAVMPGVSDSSNDPISVGFSEMENSQNTLATHWDILLWKNT